MSGQLIPPPESATPSVAHLPFAKRVELWCELVDTCDALVLANLRSQVGPDGDLEAAYREWYARKMEEHDQVVIGMLEKSSRSEHDNGMKVRGVNEATT